MALAYAALGNGGTIVTPHVGHGSRGRGRAGAEGIRAEAAAQVQHRPRHRDVILEGLHDAAQGGGGTAAAVFGGFPIPIAGKTGTAERPGPRRPVLVRGPRPVPQPAYRDHATIEEGGFGAESAAPAASTILEAYLRQAGRREVVEGEGEKPNR